MNGQTNRNSGLRTNRGNGVRGSIISLDNNSLTLKLDNGGSTIVFYASSTPINKMATGSITDLKVGEQIMAMGQANTDGSINASSLQLMSASSTFRFGVGGNGPASGDRNLP
jgi:hypothetical protein